MKVLQVTVQLEVPDNKVDLVKRVLIDQIIGERDWAHEKTDSVVVGYACEEVVQELPGDSRRGVATPFGLLPDATDEELRRARGDHPETCSHGVVLTVACEECIALPLGQAVGEGRPISSEGVPEVREDLGTRPELVGLSEEGTVADDDA